MKIDCQIMEPSKYLINLEGELTACYAVGVEKIFQKLAEIGAKQVIVDMANVPILDRRGVEALLSGLETFGGKCENFRVVSPNTQPKLMLVTTATDRLFIIHETWLMMDGGICYN